MNLKLNKLIARYKKSRNQVACELQSCLNEKFYNETEYWIQSRKIRIAELQVVLPVYDSVIADLEAKQHIMLCKKQKIAKRYA
jgi:hypothetical protein